MNKITDEMVEAAVARFKITDEMVEAAVASFAKAATDDGHPPPSEKDEPEFWKRMREVTRDALVAAAEVIK